MQSKQWDILFKKKQGLKGHRHHPQTAILVHIRHENLPFYQKNSESCECNDTLSLLTPSNNKKKPHCSLQNSNISKAADTKPRICLGVYASSPSCFLLLLKFLSFFSFFNEMVMHRLREKKIGKDWLVRSPKWKARFNEYDHIYWRKIPQDSILKNKF